VAIGDIANAFFLIPAVRSDLIKALSLGSEELAVLSESFCKQLDFLKIVTFYERHILPPFNRVVSAPITRVVHANIVTVDQVVDRPSAVMGIRGETVIPLNSDHRAMCRFESRSNDDYLMVVSQLKRLCQEAKSNRHSANMCTYRYNVFSLSLTEVTSSAIK